MSIEEIFEQALAYRASHEYRLAIPLLQELVSTNPQDARAWFFLGQTYDNQGKEKMAIPCYQKSLECGLSPQEQADARAFLTSSFLKIKDAYHASAQIALLQEESPEHRLLPKLQRRMMRLIPTQQQNTR